MTKEISNTFIYYAIKPISILTFTPGGRVVASSSLVIPTLTNNSVSTLYGIYLPKKEGIFCHPP